MIRHPIVLDPCHVRRVLIIKWSAMGDIVIASALFEDISRAFPDAAIDLNVLPPWDRLFQEDKRFREVIAFPLRGPSGGWRAAIHWLKTVGERRYDAIIDLQSNDRSRVLLTLLQLTGRPAPYLIGNHARFPYDMAPGPQPDPVHAFDHQRATLQAAGIPTITPRPVLPVTEHNRRRVGDLLDGNRLQPGEYAVFLPGSQAAGWLKRWGAERYAGLAKMLHDAGLKRIVVLGAADEMEECQKIAELAGRRVLNLCGQTEILDIVPLCSSARVIVANDTGTAHVASCTDRPMVVVCGPTDPRRVRPIGDNVIALQADIPCRNCYRKTCSHHSCMGMITPAQVLQALAPALATTQHPPSPAGEGESCR